MIAANAIVAGLESPSLAELAALSRSGDASEIALCLDRVGAEFGWDTGSRTVRLTRLFSLWACSVGSEIDAAEFMRRSRLPEANDVESSAFDWFAPLIALDTEWAEANRPRPDIEHDAYALANEWCRAARACDLP